MGYQIDFRRVKYRYLDLFNKIRESTFTLDNYAYVYRGIWTGVLKVFVIDSTVIKEFEIEEGALRPVLRGRDIRPFYYRFNDRWVIYTNQENFPEKYPNTMKYLETRKIVLERRGAVWIHGKEWWELEEPLTPDMFEIEKLVSPYTSNRNSFAYEEGKHYVMDSTIIVRFYRGPEEREKYINENKKLLEEGYSKLSDFDESYSELPPTKESLLYLLGLLNSDLLEFFIKQYAPRVSKRAKNPPKGRFYLYIPPFINILPIKIADKDTRKEIAEIATKLGEVSKKLEEAKLSEDNSDKDTVNELERTKKALQTELNEIIFEIYELDENEKAKIQDFVIKKR